MEQSDNDGVIVFDAYAWTEYALGSPAADIVAKMLDQAPEALTPASAIAELKESMLRKRIATEIINQTMEFIKSRTLVIDIDSEVAEKAGEINCNRKKEIKGWGMLDSMVCAVGIVRHGKVLTGDPHFKQLSRVIYIGS